MKELLLEKRIRDLTDIIEQLEWDKKTLNNKLSAEEGTANALRQDIAKDWEELEGVRDLRRLLKEWLDTGKPSRVYD